MRKETDLFGEPLPSPAVYRKDGRLRRIGYAARPGSGPKSQRCSTCARCIRVEDSGQYSYKCELVANAWTRGAQTDIKPNAPACSEWERKARRQVGRLVEAS